MSSALRLRVLLENECTVLCCTPTYGLHLPEVAIAERLDLTRSRIRTLVVAGEPGGSLPSVRARLASAWNGARVFDHHGMTETGPVTHEDPHAPGTLVVLGESFLPEVLRPGTAEPVPSGETGELVLTTLRRLACPLIRYRTGDLVRGEWDPSTACLRLTGGILGRVDDMVIVRGVNVYPTALDELLGTFPVLRNTGSPSTPGAHSPNWLWKWRRHRRSPRRFRAGFIADWDCESPCVMSHPAPCPASN